LVLPLQLARVVACLPGNYTPPVLSSYHGYFLVEVGFAILLAVLFRLLLAAVHVFLAVLVFSVEDFFVGPALVFTVLLTVVFTGLFVVVFGGVPQLDVKHVVGRGHFHPTHFELVVFTLEAVDLTVEDGVLVGVGVVVDTPEDDDNSGGSHGSVDSNPFATYRLKWSAPPQTCVLFPVHGVVQFPLLACAVPFPKTTPQ
jgi:hypothetical protein